MNGTRRPAFTGSSQPRLAAFLTALGHARAALPFDPERFALAESSLLEAHSMFVRARGETHKETLGCVQGLVDLYSAWHAAAPGKGYDAKAAEWNTKQDAAQPTQNQK